MGSVAAMVSTWQAERSGKERQKCPRGLLPCPAGDSLPPPNPPCHPEEGVTFSRGPQKGGH